VQVTFTTYRIRETYPPITLNGLRISESEKAKDAKYLGLYLDRILDSKKHISTKWKQLGLQLGKTEYSAVNQNCRVKTSCYYTKYVAELVGQSAPIGVSQFNTIPLDLRIWFRIMKYCSSVGFHVLIISYQSKNRVRVNDSVGLRWFADNK